MKQLFSILILIIIVSACASKHIKQIPVHTTEKIEERLEERHVDGDSAIISALFYCDSLNQVQLAELDEWKSKGMSVTFVFADNKLKLNAHTVPKVLFIPAKTVYIEKEVPIEVPYPVIEYKQRWWQNLLSWAGALSLTAIMVWGAIKIDFKSILKTAIKIIKL